MVTYAQTDKADGKGRVQYTAFWMSPPDGGAFRPELSKSGPYAGTPVGYRRAQVFRTERFPEDLFPGGTLFRTEYEAEAHGHRALTRGEVHRAIEVLEHVLAETGVFGSARQIVENALAWLRSQ